MDLLELILDRSWWADLFEFILDRAETLLELLGFILDRAEAALELPGTPNRRSGTGVTTERFAGLVGACTTAEALARRLGLGSLNSVSFTSSCRDGTLEIAGRVAAAVEGCIK